MNKSVRQKIIEIARLRIAISLGISAREVVNLSGCSYMTALAAIRDIVASNPKLLNKTTKRWVVAEGQEPPAEWLLDASITETVFSGADSSAGILSDDIEINHVRFTAHNPVADTAIMMSVRASRYRKSGAHHRGAIRIRYVGLRRNELAKWRTIIPIRLEEFSGKWRIIGIDAEKDEIRTFQLSRIIEVDRSLYPIPANVIVTGAYSPKRRVKISLSKDLTDDQRIAAINELGVDNEMMIELTEGQIHDMRHLYGVDKPTDNIVWPVIDSMEII
ncbi:MAG: hypothetical protein Q8K61_12645 [Gallionella sp.]|nr:hypothetical protein [Gallionella sp.]